MKSRFIEGENKICFNRDPYYLVSRQNAKKLLKKNNMFILLTKLIMSCPYNKNQQDELLTFNLFH